MVSNSGDKLTIDVTPVTMARNKQNTPVIIKFPFWPAVEENPRAFYACVNMGEAAVPQALQSRSLCINQDIADVLHALKGKQ